MTVFLETFLFICQLYVYLLSPRVKFKFYYIVLCSMIVLYEVMKYNTVIVQAF